MRTMQKCLAIISLCLISGQAIAGAGMHMPDKIHKVAVKHFEVLTDDTALVHLEGWYGDELRKTTWSAEWRKTDEHENSEISLGYVWATSAFWDGGPVLSVEEESEPGERHREHWFGWQFKGTAPYFIHTDFKTLLGEQQQFKMELELEHEFPLSKHWLLESKLELEGGRFADDGRHEVALESWRVGWRLQYETVARFRYYTGVEYADDEHADSQEWRFLTGLSYWW